MVLLSKLFDLAISILFKIGFSFFIKLARKKFRSFHTYRFREEMIRDLHTIMNHMNAHRAVFVIFLLDKGYFEYFTMFEESVRDGMNKIKPKYKKVKLSYFQDFYDQISSQKEPRFYKISELNGIMGSMMRELGFKGIACAIVKDRSSRPKYLLQVHCMDEHILTNHDRDVLSDHIDKLEFKYERELGLVDD